MNSDNVAVFLPVIGTVAGTLVAGLTWLVKWLVGTINTKDQQLMASLKVQQEATNNGTLAIQQAASAAAESRTALQALTVAVESNTRAVETMLERNNSRAPSRRRST
jgi:hypothetical protein